jgi:hypothetical protein
LHAVGGLAGCRRVFCLKPPAPALRALRLALHRRQAL